MGEWKEFDRSVEVEALFLHVSELIYELMENEGISRAELARRLEVSRSRVTQMMRTSPNLTMKTVAEVLYELGYRLECKVVKLGS